MRIFEYLIFFCLMTCLSDAKNVNLTAHGYHMKVGIPKARALMVAETTRIVGGNQVSSSAAHPHQAGLVVLLTTGWTSICGGSLVSINRVLTAAHCWWDGQVQAKQFTVVLGSLTIFNGGTRIETKDVTVHPNWNTNDITFDIAIVRIKSVSFNNNIQPIPLPTMNDVNQNFAGLEGMVTGYGKTSDAQNNIPSTTSLHQTLVSIITNKECQKSFDISIHNSHLCTNGKVAKGTCEGDSGGPLTVVWNNRRTQIGIVSFGLGNGCQAGFPSVFTRVTAFLNWINDKL